jgi:histidyl-tRNA synthetase
MSLPQSAPSVALKPDVYIAPLGAGMNREAARLARELRREELVVELGDETFRLKKSFDAAAKLGARFVLIVGENEVKAGAFALKNQETGEQVSVAREELARKVEGLLERFKSFSPPRAQRSSLRAWRISLADSAVQCCSGTIADPRDR